MHRLLTGPLSIEHLTVAIAQLPPACQGTRIVQLSDFHYDGLRLSENLLAKAIAASNDSDPDLVVLTGDFVTTDASPVHRLVQRLKHLRSRAGVYAVLGNHDLYYPGSKAEITAALQQNGIQVLWNEVAYPLGTGLAVVGLADYWSREFNPASVMDRIDAAIPRVVLSHNPDTAVELQRWRVDLQLSGHTHGGQVVLPRLGPVPSWATAIRCRIPKSVRRWLPYLRKDCAKVVRNWSWAQGLHSVGTNSLYVNRGLGTYLPGRLFCPPEVSIITLVKSVER